MEWIGVNDRLPSTEDDVLVTLSSGFVSLGYWCFSYRKWLPSETIEPTYDHSRTQFCDDVTYWAICPEPKKS